MSESDAPLGQNPPADDVVPDNPVSDEPAVNIRYPEQAREALTAVVGHEVTLRLVDAGATALAAWEGSQDETGDAYFEALEVAARSGMPDDERDVKAIVEQNEPLPSPGGAGSDPAAVLQHTLTLAVDHVGHRRLRP